MSPFLRKAAKSPEERKTIKRTKKIDIFKLKTQKEKELGKKRRKIEIDSQNKKLICACVKNEMQLFYTQVAAKCGPIEVVNLIFSHCHS